MSNRGTIIHLDNDEEILQRFKKLYDQSGIDLDLVPCQTIDKFNELVKEHENSLKGLIFDLLSSEPNKDELHKGDAEFLESVERSFSSISIPIFIYSGFLEAIEEQFETHGTVFKIDKGDGPDEIIRLIKRFKESGFLEIFCPGGKIEREIHQKLTASFSTQFSNNSQIEEIIDIISKNSEGDELVSRVEKVFTRMAIGSLYSDLRSPDVDDKGHIKKMNFANPVEHYMQRISPFEFWTGDILKNNDEHIIILTPRCNVASKSHEELLVCRIDTGAFPTDTSNRDERDKIKYALTDKPEISGYDRFIPPSPLFKTGGKILFSTFSMVKKSDLRASYERVTSLSDELTNEILGKFGAYFFRTGITPWDQEETLAHIKEIAADD